MKNIRLTLNLIIFCLMLGCASHKSANTIRSPKFRYAASTSTNPENISNTPVNDKAEIRKIIYSANLHVSVDNPDSAGIQIEKIALKYNGYVNKTGTESAIIRVKSSCLDSALTDIASIGKITHKSIKGQDVTEEYLDNQIRLENALNARKRYLELLEKAENVEAALKVEKELERLNGEIDLLKGKINRIDHLAIYSTITIQINERKKPGLLGYIGLGFYHAVKWLFVRN